MEEKMVIATELASFRLLVLRINASNSLMSNDYIASYSSLRSNNDLGLNP